MIAVAATMVVMSTADACTRVVYEGKNMHFMTARSLDWAEDMHSDIWVYPRGMYKDGGIDEHSIQWTSKYPSVTTSGYDAGTVDAMNEKGLFANILYLAEADYGKSDRPTLSIDRYHRGDLV